MQQRTLGNSTLDVSPLVLGGNVFGWTADEATSFKVLDAFVGAGFNFIDTADMYSVWVPGHQGGESEAVIGKWLKRSGKRHQVVLATKVGMDLGHDRKGLSAAYIQRAVEASLKRLQTDYIDLYQSHKDDPDTALEETLGAYARLIEQGKVRVIGASNYSAERLSEALELSSKQGYPRYESLQPEYNLVERAEFENTLAPLCIKENVGVINYYGLASGFLSGKYRSEKDLGERARSGAVKKYLTPRGLAVLEALDEVAAKHDATPAQIALAWLVARPGVTAPIASATSSEQLAELLAGVQIELDPQEMERLNVASDNQ